MGNGALPDIPTDATGVVKSVLNKAGEVYSGVRNITPEGKKQILKAFIEGWGK